MLLLLDFYQRKQCSFEEGQSQRRSNQARQLVAVIVLVQLPLSCWRALAKGQAEQVILGVALLWRVATPCTLPGWYLNWCFLLPGQGCFDTFAFSPSLSVLLFFLVLILVLSAPQCAFASVQLPCLSAAVLVLFPYGNSLGLSYNGNSRCVRVSL